MGVRTAPLDQLAASSLDASGEGNAGDEIFPLNACGDALGVSITRVGFLERKFPLDVLCRAVLPSTESMERDRSGVFLFALDSSLGKPYFIDRERLGVVGAPSLELSSVDAAYFLDRERFGVVGNSILDRERLGVLGGESSRNWRSATFIDRVRLGGSGAHGISLDMSLVSSSSLVRDFMFFLDPLRLNRPDPCFRKIRVLAENKLCRSLVGECWRISSCNEDCLFNDESF